MEASESNPSSQPQTQLGKYRLVAALGRGGMADVFLAMLEGPSGFNKLLVIKELRQGVLEDGTAVQMFMDEAHLAARLNHPNIVQTLEVGSDGPRCFLVMEYLDGQPLPRVIRRARERGAQIPLQTHVRILVEVLTALDYAHSFTDFDGRPLSIVHRDVSPQNILLTYEGGVKLIDFGIAKTALASGETREGIVKGKVKYMPPEQAMGHAVDARTDIFAVGVLLWEALAGHGPWHGQGEVAIFRSLMSGAVPRLSEVSPELDADLVAIVDRAMSPKAFDRYLTAAAMRDDLESWIATCRTPPGSPRDLAALLRMLFDEDRRTLRGHLDAAIRRPDNPQPISLTRLRTDLSEVTQAPSVSKLGSVPKAYTSPVPPAPDPPLYAKLRTRSRLAMGVAAVTLVGASVVMQLRSQRPAAGPAAAAVEPATPESPHASPQREAVREEAAALARVQIRALPPSARLYVDDVAVNNPYAADLVREATHRVRADAPGYVPQTRSFVAGSDGDLDLVLDREPWRGVRPPALMPTARSAAVPTAGAATPPATLDVSAPARSAEVPPPRRKPKHELDKEDPYTQ
jgi:serine/threonine-protein kinase